MGKVSIITGGSRGIGEAMALKLGELGYNVVINYRSDSSKVLSDNLAAKINKDYGVETLVVKADVSKYEDTEKIVKTTLERYGQIDLLMNNAGVAIPGNGLSLPLRDWEWIVQTNLMSHVYLMFR